MPIIPQEIPKKIHFIWLGCPLPEKYLLTIEMLCGAATQSGFETNLWLESKAHIQKMHVRLKTRHLRLRTMSSLIEKMEHDSFYQEDDRLQKFWDGVDRERVGAKNLAAASDFLRYEILRQEGGYYLDTDSKLEIALDTVLTVDQPILGIKTNLRPNYSIQRKSEENIEIAHISDFTGGNDIIACLPGHPVLRSIIKYAIASYAMMDQSKEMDLKRSPFTGKFLDARKFNTMGATGPDALRRVLFAFWSNQENKSVSACNSMEFQNPESFQRKIAGVKAGVASDVSWLQPSKRLSYDDTSLVAGFFSRTSKVFSRPYSKKRKIESKEETSDIKQSRLT